MNIIDQIYFYQQQSYLCIDATQHTGKIFRITADIWLLSNDKG